MRVLACDSTSIESTRCCVTQWALRCRSSLLLHNVGVLGIAAHVIHVVVLDALQGYPMIGACRTLLLLLLEIR